MSDFAEFAEVRGRAAARRAIDETDSTVLSIDATSPAMSLQSMTVAVSGSAWSAGSYGRQTCSLSQLTSFGLAALSKERPMIALGGARCGKKNVLRTGEGGARSGKR